MKQKKLFYLVVSIFVMGMIILSGCQVGITNEDSTKDQTTNPTDTKETVSENIIVTGGDEDSWYIC